MKKFYRKRDRVTAVKLWLTADQIAVLINHALYRRAPGALSVQAEAQFVLDWACSTGNALYETADNLRELGSHALPFNPQRLPDPQDEREERQREKRRRWRLRQDR